MAAPVVETTAGRVAGAERDGVRVFLGIPYAAGTGGANRFRAPQPREPWTGVRDALAYGSSAPQQQSAAGAGVADEIREAFGHGDELVIDEDCLFVNVWTPGPDAGRRPVMVWLHGGGFTTGSGSSDAFDGTNLARDDDVVVVTINHRLGLTAFTYLGDLVGDAYADSGNAGTLDMVAALAWVRDNIAAFGGDPGNVTIFGESGGGAKVSVLLAVPAARGLFHRAICQSGVAGGLMALPERADATESTERFLAELGVGTADVAALHALPLERLLEAERALSGGGLMGSGGFSRAPVVDGHVLVSQPFDAVADGTAADVPLIVGTTRDEGATFLAGIPAMLELSRDDVAATAATWGRGVAIDGLLPLYERNRPEAMPCDLVVALMSDATFRIPSIELAERRWEGGGRSPVFMYLFTWESPVLGGILKAGHGLDIRFVFDNVGRSAATPGDPATRGLASVMSRAWASFARTGDPNHDGMPAWPAYDLPARSTMCFDTPSRVVDDPLGDEREAWAAVRGAAGRSHA